MMGAAAASRPCPGHRSSVCNNGVCLLITEYQYAALLCGRRWIVDSQSSDCHYDCPAKPTPYTAPLLRVGGFFPFLSFLVLLAFFSEWGESGEAVSALAYTGVGGPGSSPYGVISGIMEMPHAAGDCIVTILGYGLNHHPSPSPSQLQPS